MPPPAAAWAGPTGEIVETQEDYVPELVTVAEPSPPPRAVADFPVGSRVRHRRRGEGSVIAPPEGDARLWVQYDCNDLHRYGEASLRRGKLQPAAYWEVRMRQPRLTRQPGRGLAG